MADALHVALPGGLVIDGARRTDAALRPVTGADEEAVQTAATAGPFAQADLLLARCVTTVGDRTADPDVLASLVVGDREALLWHLRRATIGDRLDAIVECASCHEKLDIELRVGDLLASRYPQHPGELTERIDGRDVVFGVPTVADLTAADVTLADDADAGARALLQRVVRRVDAVEPTADDLDALRDGVERRIAELDPQAETLLTMRCPVCDADVSTILDAAAFLVEELARRSRHLAAEVHTLAWYYHWSEAEILGLPTHRRHRYLELIGDAVRHGGAS